MQPTKINLGQKPIEASTLVLGLELEVESNEIKKLTAPPSTPTTN
jgi:hypothetical protein